MNKNFFIERGDQKKSLASGAFNLFDTKTILANQSVCVLSKKNTAAKLNT